MRLLLHHTRILTGNGLPGKFIRAGIVLLLLCLSIPSFTQVVVKDPDVDSICVDQSVTFTFTGVWGTNSRWTVPGQADKDTNPMSTSWSNAGNKTVTARVRNSPDEGTYYSYITVVEQPTSPTLNTQTPASPACEGELLSATFNPGTGGVGCSDEFRYATRTGAVWSSWNTYTPGQQLLTGGIDEIVIEGRRSNCASTAGCTASAWTQLAQWLITNDPTPPVIVTCATDKFYDAGPACQVTVPDLTGEVVATDNCDPFPVVTQSPIAGTIIGEGVTTVTLTVTDAGSNTAECTADITVTDITPPSFSACPADINLLADTSYCGAEVSWTPPTASDNCPGYVVTSSHDPGDFFPVGTTTVTYVVTDVSSQTDTCRFDVIVGNATPAVITGPTEVCTPVQETYSVTDPGSHTFDWTVTNGTIVGSSTTPTITVEWTGTAQGTVEVTITSGSLCTNYNSIIVDKGVTPSTGIISSSGTLIRR